MYTLHLSSTHTYNCQGSTTTRNRFVKFSLDGCCGEKVKFTRDICRRKLSTGSYRTDPTIPTMMKCNGFVRFSVDSRCGQKMKLTSRRVPRTCVISTTKASGVIDHVVKTGNLDNINPETKRVHVVTFTAITSQSFWGR